MRLLGLDIGAHEVRVARAERVFGALRLTAVERVPCDDPARVLSTLARERPGTVLTVLPVRRVTHRILVLPFRDRRRLLRAAPMEILGQLPLDADGLTVACEPLGPAPGGTAVLAAAVRREDVEAHVALLSAAGLAPARVELAPLPAWNLLAAGDEEVALLVADGRESALVLGRGGRIAGLRALGATATDVPALAAEARWTLGALGGTPSTIVLAGPDGGRPLAAALAAGTGARVVQFADAVRLPVPRGADDLAACAVAAGLAAGRGRPSLVLGGAKPAEDGALRRIAALALLALALGGLDLSLARHRLARRDAALVRAIETEAAAVLPGAPLMAPLAQAEAAAEGARRRAMRLGGDTSVLEMLRELSARTPAALRLDLDELAIDADGLRVHGRAESFEAVDALRRALAAVPSLRDVAPDETRTTVDGRRVEFRLRAARRAARGAIS